jgi:hypothetical protein
MITQDIRRVESVTGHVLRAVGRAFVKVFTGFLVGGIIGAGAVEGVKYFNGGFSALGHIAAAVFGVVLGYAVGLTMAVGEAIRALIDAGKEATKGAENLEKTVPVMWKKWRAALRAASVASSRPSAANSTKSNNPVAAKSQTGMSEPR